MTTLIARNVSAARIGSRTSISASACAWALPLQTPRQQQEQRRLYAADVKGKVAKTGQKKVDKKADDEGDALPFFYPKPPTGPLPKIGHLKPQQVGLPDEPRRNRESHQLLRAIDVDHRARHDFDGRTELFAAGSPTAVEPGSVLLVEQISCRSSPRKMAFAGVLIAVSRKGLMSTITLKNYVLGTGVEMVFPIYSPMVTRIKVLKRVEGFAKGRDNVYALRDRPALAPLSFSSIDGMVMKDAEIERKLSANKK